MGSALEVHGVHGYAWVSRVLLGRQASQAEQHFDPPSVVFPRAFLISSLSPRSVCSWMRSSGRGLAAAHDEASSPAPAGPLRYLSASVACPCTTFSRRKRATSWACVMLCACSSLPVARLRFASKFLRASARAAPRTCMSPARV